MKEFDEYIGLVDKSVEIDPWVKDNGLVAYCKGIREEADEVIDALNNNETKELIDELGDILYDWAHVCRLAESENKFSMLDVIKASADKIRRRKPYLLEDNKKITKDEAERIWMRVKEEERKTKKPKDEEFVYYVDENDNEIGKVTRKDSVVKNLWHRGTGIMVFNKKGEILIHRRSKTKDRFPGYWTMFFGGNVSYGETYEQNAARELLEETGLEEGSLEFLYDFKFSSPETKVISKVFRVVSDGPFRFQESEIEEALFVDLGSLRDLMDKDKFTPDGLESFSVYNSKYRDVKNADK